MKQLHIALATACTICSTAVSSDASAQTRAISTTPYNQILVELAPEDTTPANLFDLN